MTPKPNGHINVTPNFHGDVHIWMNGDMQHRGQQDNNKKMKNGDDYEGFLYGSFPGFLDGLQGSLPGFLQSQGDMQHLQQQDNVKMKMQLGNNEGFLPGFLPGFLNNMG